jgi:hypothetical protein
MIHWDGIGNVSVVPRACLKKKRAFSGLSRFLNLIQFSSLPGLTRQSIFFRRMMDARVKPAHDELADRDAIKKGRPKAALDVVRWNEKADYSAAGNAGTSTGGCLAAASFSR